MKKYLPEPEGGRPFRVMTYFKGLWYSSFPLRGIICYVLLLIIVSISLYYLVSLKGETSLDLIQIFIFTLIFIYLFNLPLFRFATPPSAASPPSGQRGYSLIFPFGEYNC